MTWLADCHWQAHSRPKQGVLASSRTRTRLWNLCPPCLNHLFLLIKTWHHFFEDMKHEISLRALRYWTPHCCLLWTEKWRERKKRKSRVMGWNKMDLVSCKPQRIQVEKMGIAPMVRKKNHKLSRKSNPSIHPNPTLVRQVNSSKLISHITEDI